ncbi:MAG: hypothetical protein GY822_27280 [Deltaproteobacteria bacterium]|nr:hypothetical protein [Deltaproteobacteria bacterium]
MAKVGQNPVGLQLQRKLQDVPKLDGDEVVRRMQNLTDKGELSLPKAKQLQNIFQQLPPAEQAKVEAFVAQKLDVMPQLGAVTGQVADAPAAKEAPAFAHDETTSKPVVAEGLSKIKTQVSSGQASQTRQLLGEFEVQGKTGQRVGKNQFTPQGMAAKELSSALSKSHPNASAAMKAMNQPVNNLMQKTVAEMVKNPAAAKDLAGIIGQISTKEGAGTFAKQVGEAFAKSTGVPPTNPAAIKSALNGLHTAAMKVGGSHAPEMAATLSKVGAKFGVEVGGKAASTVAGKAAGKAAGEVATKVAGKAAAGAAEKTLEKGAVKVAAAGGKTVPGVGNCIAAASTCMGVVKLFKAITTKPRSGEKIAKEGLNTLMQGVGIAFPWVALGGDVMDLGWEAKMAMSQVSKSNPDAAKSPELQQQVADFASQNRGLTASDAASTLTGPAQLLQATLSGAGYGKAADSMGALAGGANAIAKNGGELSTLQPKEVDAFMQTWNAASGAIGKEATVETDPSRKQQLEHLSHGFGQLFQAAYKHKKMNGAEGPKREDLKADVVGILKDVGPSAAAILQEELEKARASGQQV